MLVGAVIVLFEGENPASVAWAIVKGVISEPNGIANTLIAASPLLLIGLGLACGLPRRGFLDRGRGQYVVGATAAVVWVTAPGPR